jgi:DNA-directed RNA polymerase subunit alpha
MDQVEQDVDTMDQIAEKDSWSVEDHDALMAQVSELSDPAGRLASMLRQLENENPQPKGAPALKIGILRYMLCRFQAALEALSDATDNKDRHWFQAMCCKHLQQYARAGEEFERAESRGWDGGEVALQQAELMVLRGEMDQADKALKKLSASLGDSPDFLYVKGMLLELTGQGEEAASLYIQARELAKGHAGATFRLAYFYDLHGEEEEAIDLYREIIAHPPIFANALLNLAVLHEDAGQYSQASEAVRRVLAINPNHGRAQMFLKDAEASKTMYYDEDQARRIAKRNAVLDIPVTDFELSVRARNCLKKMNIRTLGDLVNTTESELLGYKNFGETSLKEIKDMLTAKGLRLGQAMEDEAEYTAGPSQGTPFPMKETPQEQGAGAIPVEQVEFSIRARRVLDQLGIRTMGELASRSEAELLSQKNFGQTSLNELRQKLHENGLDFRDND